MLSNCSDAIVVAGCSSLITYGADMIQCMFLLGPNGVVRTVFQFALHGSIVFILRKLEGCFIHATWRMGGHSVRKHFLELNSCSKPRDATRVCLTRLQDELPFKSQSFKDMLSHQRVVVGSMPFDGLPRVESLQQRYPVHHEGPLQVWHSHLRR